MTIDIAIVLFIILLAFVLFLTEFFPVDVTALTVLGILLLTGLITPTESIMGFSNPAVIIIATLFVLSTSLQKSGILEYFVLSLNKLATHSLTLGLIVFLIAIALTSSIVNNTAIVAIFMPITIRLAQKYKLSPSKLLIPLSYAAILGGTLTLVGTSTNLLVNSIMQNYGDIKPLGMFEFTKFGVLTLIVGLIYIVTMGNRLLPSRTVTSSLTKSYHLGGYLTEMKISKESPLVDRTCMERSLNHNYDIIVLDILRNGELITSNIRNTKLKEGDILFIRGSVDSFLRLKTIEKLSMLTDEKLNQSELVQENNVLVECLLTNKSELIGTSLMAANFRRRFGSFVLAIRREGTIIRKKLAYIILRAYDTLLVYGSREKVQEMASTGDFIILEELETSLKKHKLWWLSSILIIAVMLLSALGIVPILKGAIIAVVILLTLKVISPVEAYNSIHWQVIVLIATLIPLGHAIQTSGTADWIGNNIIILVRLFPDQMQPRMLLALIYLLTIILTETSSNAATAIIVTPIAIVSSINLGLDPRPFIFAVCFAASASFITPIGYQTNLMVYGPGGYKFKDFIRVGFPLSVIIWILGIIFIPVFWPFHLQ